MGLPFLAPHRGIAQLPPHILFCTYSHFFVPCFFPAGIAHGKDSAYNKLKGRSKQRPGALAIILTYYDISALCPLIQYQPSERERRMPNEPISKPWFDKMKGKEAFITRLFTVFLREEPQRVAKIRTAMESRQLGEVTYLAHSLKGAAATLGAEPLHEACLQLELAAKSEDEGQSVEALRQLDEQIERVYERMQDWLKLQ
ncbi:Hpt domain-containing protein [Paucidesulfovibrio gracilis DSM 16080]|uniref:Hpt domain-containing protein n=2 Tax=Paucidesulfovibrio TaxID=2910985 RepID=A0A1T4WSS4_9BACT|nr:Hpt domain-containing protein [Paucidesulfovibrio gracilis DSM 16080]